MNNGLIGYMASMWLFQVKELTDLVEQKLALVAQLEQEQQQLLARCQALQTLVGAQPEVEAGVASAGWQGIGGGLQQQQKQTGESTRCVLLLVRAL